MNDKRCTPVVKRENSHRITPGQRVAQNQSTAQNQRKDVTKTGVMKNSGRSGSVNDRNTSKSRQHHNQKDRNKVDVLVRERRRRSLSYTEMTKEEYVQANFRFVMNACVNEASNEMFMDPDHALPWDDVERVIVSMEAQEKMQQCPVCLGLTNIPKITKCGHLFCYTCILRHLGLESHKKCPICNDKVERADLRSVTFAMSVQPKLGQLFSFSLIQCNRGSLHPHLMTKPHSEESLSSSSSLLSNKETLSTEKTHQGVFSRVVMASKENMKNEFEAELELLHEFRRLCLPDQSCRQEGYAGAVLGSSGNPDAKPIMTRPHNVCDYDVEYLPAIAEAVCLTMDRQEAFEKRCKKEKEKAKVSVLPEGDKNGMIVGSTYFYQSGDGGLFFLHPMCYRALMAQAQGDIESLPRMITSEVLEVESVRVTIELRKRFSFLRHLPLHADVKFVEVNVTELVTTGVLDSTGVRAEIVKREQNRKKKQKLESKSKRQDAQVRVDHAERVERMKALHEKREKERQERVDAYLSGPTLGSSESEIDRNDVMTNRIDMTVNSQSHTLNFARIVRSNNVESFPELPAASMKMSLPAPKPTAWKVAPAVPPTQPQPTATAKKGKKTKLIGFL
jgi:hypothetical protein